MDIPDSVTIDLKIIIESELINKANVEIYNFQTKLRINYHLNCTLTMHTLM